MILSIVSRGLVEYRTGGQQPKRNKTIILLPEAVGGCSGLESWRKGIRLFFFDRLQRNKIKILLRLRYIYAIIESSGKTVSL